MARHPRFPDHRWLGDKRSFLVYDLDDEEQAEVIEEIPLEDCASFAPDTLAEARNRNYRPAAALLTEE